MNGTICVLSLLKAHRKLKMYNCVWIVIHGIQGRVYLKKKTKNSVPIFTSQCAEMYWDWTSVRRVR